MIQRFLVLIISVSAVMLQGCLTKTLVSEAGRETLRWDRIDSIDRAFITGSDGLVICATGTRAGESGAGPYSVSIPAPYITSSSSGAVNVQLPRSLNRPGACRLRSGSVVRIPVDNLTLVGSAPEHARLKHLRVPACAPGAVFLLSDRYYVYVRQRDGDMPASDAGLDTLPRNSRTYSIFCCEPVKTKSGSYMLAALPVAVAGDIVVAGVYLVLNFWRLPLLL